MMPNARVSASALKEMLGLVAKVTTEPLTNWLGKDEHKHTDDNVSHVAYDCVRRVVLNIDACSSLDRVHAPAEHDEGRPYSSHKTKNKNGQLLMRVHSRQSLWPNA
ncbi:hypothetical protein SAMN05428972_0873 [Rhodanobacter sp. OK091]|nr:hypothetical protein SAMN05428972_0873 [Rhodanobacter sp. OK091]